VDLRHILRYAADYARTRVEGVALALQWKVWSARLLPSTTLVIALAGHGAAGHVGKWPLATALPLMAAGVALVCWTVFETLEHAEVLAHHFGEPLGTLVLTLAVTAIEASVIVSLMLQGENNPTLARESVFSTVMIVTTGVLGVSLFLGGWRHRFQNLQREGTNSFLAVLVALCAIALVLPNYALMGRYTPFELGFVSLLSVLLYLAFLYAQTIRHQEDFLGTIVEHAQLKQHTERHPVRHVWAAAAAQMVVGLVGIVLLAEQIASTFEIQLEAAGIEQTDAIIGAFIATLVLLPESVAAIRAALANQLQRSINIALGSACATIGLTIPVVGAASLITGRELVLGLTPGDTTLLMLALALCVISFGTGRTTGMTGLVHLVAFLAYLMLIVVP
jgi:Ca2+:H+ antiporter